MTMLSCVEICAGAGGESLGLEYAGFEPQALVEIDSNCCNTLRANRSRWNVIENDIKEFNGGKYKNVDLLAGGLPCPPFSKAGKQLGSNDERDLFPEALRLIEEIKPGAVMLENVRGFLDPVFENYRLNFKKRIETMGYIIQWNILNASGFGVSQLRPRVVIVAVKESSSNSFSWPEAGQCVPATVGNLLEDQMSANGWRGVKKWVKQANGIAPTIVGGSKRHGGPDLGPTRAREAWAKLGVDGRGIADIPPEKDFDGMPRLTVKMAARIQGFPDDWRFTGRKTVSYRQVGNAFPPPVSHAVGRQIYKYLTDAKKIFKATG